MSDKFVFRVEGLDDIRTALKRVSPDLDKRLKKDIRAALTPVAVEAKTLARKRSGNLASKVRVEILRFGAAVGSRATYAAVDEFGKKRQRGGTTQKLTPSLALMRALRANAPRVRAKLEDSVRRAVADYFGTR